MNQLDLSNFGNLFALLPFLSKHCCEKPSGIKEEHHSDTTQSTSPGPQDPTTTSHPMYSALQSKKVKVEEAENTTTSMVSEPKQTAQKASDTSAQPKKITNTSILNGLTCRDSALDSYHTQDPSEQPTKDLKDQEIAKLMQKLLQEKIEKSQKLKCWPLYNLKEKESEFDRQIKSRKTLEMMKEKVIKRDEYEKKFIDFDEIEAARLKPVQEAAEKKTQSLNQKPTMKKLAADVNSKRSRDTFEGPKPKVKNPFQKGDGQYKKLTREQAKQNIVNNIVELMPGMAKSLTMMNQMLCKSISSVKTNMIEMKKKEAKIQKKDSEKNEKLNEMAEKAAEKNEKQNDVVVKSEE